MDKAPSGVKGRAPLHLQNPRSYKSQLGWLNPPHSPILPPPVTAKQRVVIIPGDQPEEGIDGCGFAYYVMQYVSYHLNVQNRLFIFLTILPIHGL